MWTLIANTIIITQSQHRITITGSSLKNDFVVFILLKMFIFQETKVRRPINLLVTGHYIEASAFVNDTPTTRSDAEDILNG